MPNLAMTENHQFGHMEAKEASNVTAERFRLELAYSLERVGMRVIAKPRGGFGAPSADIRVTGDLSPEDAIAFAEALRAKAAAVKTRNAKREAENARRKERLSGLPKIEWRTLRSRDG